MINCLLVQILLSEEQQLGFDKLALSIVNLEFEYRLSKETEMGYEKAPMTRERI